MTRISIGPEFKQTLAFARAQPKNPCCERKRALLAETKIGSIGMGTSISQSDRDVEKRSPNPLQIAPKQVCASRDLRRTPMSEYLL